MYSLNKVIFTENCLRYIENLNLKSETNLVTDSFIRDKRIVEKHSAA